MVFNADHVEYLRARHESFSQHKLFERLELSDELHEEVRVLTDELRERGVERLGFPGERVPLGGGGGLHPGAMVFDGLLGRRQLRLEVGGDAGSVERRWSAGLRRERR